MNEQRRTDSDPEPSRSIAVALGGGGARGLAHILVVEAMDELGLRPARIAGTSIGAVVGAVWAAGMTGREMRAFVTATLRNRGEIFSRLMRARVGRFADLFSGRFANQVLLDPETVLDLFWPTQVPDRFEDLAIAFEAVATDYYGRCATIFDSGPLVTAVAASIAIPGLFRPVEADGRALIDGGIVNPLPYPQLFAPGAFVIACDVTGGPAPGRRGTPQPFEALFGASQIMQATITAHMLAARAPDLLIRPPVERFRVLDFFQATKILAAAEPVKDLVKRSLDVAFAARRSGS